MKIGFFLPVLGLLLSTGFVQAYDEDDEDGNIRLSGFASVVLGHGDDDLPYDFNAQKTQVEYEDKASFRPDTRIGVQLDWDISEKFGASVQALGRANDDFVPELAWGFLSYQATDDLKFRLGRLRYPFYFYSDYIDIGYAYPWITPPREAYFVGVETLDALNVLYNFSTGDIDHQIEAYYGQSRDTQNGNDDVKIIVDDSWGITWTPSWEWLTLRFSYHKAEVSFDSAGTDTLTAGVQGLADNGLVSQDIADQANYKNQDGVFTGIGAKLDFDTFWVITEYNQLDIPDLLVQHSKRAYISAGYFITDDIQVYGLYERSKDDDNHYVSNAVNTAAGFLPFPANSQTAGLAAALKDQETGSDVRSSGIGVRWDVMSGVALKAQYTHIDDRRAHETGNVFRIAIDTVF